MFSFDFKASQTESLLDPDAQRLLAADDWNRANVVYRNRVLNLLQQALRLDRLIPSLWDYLNEDGVLVLFIQLVCCFLQASDSVAELDVSGLIELQEDGTPLPTLGSVPISTSFISEEERDRALNLFICSNCPQKTNLLKQRGVELLRYTFRLLSNPQCDLRSLLVLLRSLLGHFTDAERLKSMVDPLSSSLLLFHCLPYLYKTEVVSLLVECWFQPFGSVRQTREFSILLHKFGFMEAVGKLLVMEIEVDS